MSDYSEIPQESARRRVQELEFLVNLSHHLTASLDVEEVLRRIADGVVKILDAFGCAIYLLEDDGVTLTPMAVIDPKFYDEIIATPLRVDDSFTGQAIKAQRGLVFNEMFAGDGGKQIPDTPELGDEAVLAAPLIVDEQVLGGMAVSKVGDSFSDHDLWLAEAFARYASIALKNAQMYQALYVSEARFRAIFNDIPAAIWTFSREGRILEWNETAEQIYGWPAEEAIGKTMFELMVQPKNVERTWQGIEAIFQGEQLLEQEYEDICADGSKRTFLSHGYPIKNSAGDVEKGVFAEIDITDRKKTELALRENELRYRTLFGAINSGVAVYRVVGNGDDFIFTDFNRAGERMGGINRADIIGKSVVEVFPNVVEFGLVEVFRRVWRTGIAERFPLVIRTGGKLGGWRDNYVYKLPSGEIVAVHDDVTVQKQAEEARERALRQYQSLVEQAPYAIARIERTGVIQYFNPRFTEIFGYDINDIPTVATWFETVYPDLEYREMVKEIWKQIWRKFEDRNTPRPPTILTVTTKDGREVITRFHRVQLDDGTALVTMEDITTQKETEAALKESEARLQQAQKMESIGTLAGGVAHDFNNLLTAINGQAELGLMKLPADHAVRKNLEGILVAGNRAAKLTGQLLAFSRRQMYHPQAVDINRHVNDLQEMLRHLIREDITIETNLAPNLPPVKADPHQLEQILINLMVNARDAIYARKDFSARKKITIETGKIEIDGVMAALRPEMVPGRYVCFCISDTGAGMDDAVRQKIFEPFFTTKPKGQGTGLGLAMVYGIVRQNGGHITVYSEKGTGTTFKIFWPPAELAHKDAVGPQEDNAQTLTGTETILLVEDDRQVCSFAAASLQALGYTLLVAENGVHALNLLAEGRSQSIDMLLTDVIMPEMDGAELANTLRKANPRLPVLFMSGYTHDFLGEHGSLVPSVHFLQKPFSTQTLARSVRATLDESMKSAER